MAHVAKEIGAIAKPDLIRFTDALPKTRSGKIMRRLLRDVAAGTDSQQDVTTLEDFSVMARLRGDELRILLALLVILVCIKFSYDLLATPVDVYSTAPFIG